MSESLTLRVGEQQDINKESFICRIQDVIGSFSY